MAEPTAKPKNNEQLVAERPQQSDTYARLPQETQAQRERTSVRLRVPIHMYVWAGRRGRHIYFARQSMWSVGGRSVVHGCSPLVIELFRFQLCVQRRKARIFGVLRPERKVIPAGQVAGGRVSFPDATGYFFQKQGCGEK